MYYGKRKLILTCLAAILAGYLLHFLYRALPCAAAALFSPVNESLWEHGKLIFWPFLGSAFLLNRGRPGGMRPWLLVLPLLLLGMLLAGWLYHIVLGGEARWVDLALYVLAMVAGFLAASRFSGPFSGVKWVLPVAAALGLGVLFALFTLWPPENILFTDLSGACTWVELPC